MKRSWTAPMWVALLPALHITLSCYSHRRPVRIVNDTAQAIQAFGWAYKQLPSPGREAPELLPIAPGKSFGDLTCAKDLDFFYLSTASHPEIVAYRMRDICEPDACSCEIKVSQLEARRNMSVPWREAGTILPAGVR